MQALSRQLHPLYSPKRGLSTDLVGSEERAHAPDLVVKAMCCGFLTHEIIDYVPRWYTVSFAAHRSGCRVAIHADIKARERLV